MKPDVKNAEGAQLNNNFEYFTSGFHLVDASRTMEDYNFKPNELHSNVVTTNGILSKMKHSSNGKPINL
jgi:hypothetical protein